MISNGKVKLTKNKKDLNTAFRIRRIVFVKEQKVTPELEYEFEDVSKHFLIYYKNKPVGACRVRFIGNKSKLERLAVLKKYRGLGLGKLAIKYMISYSKRFKKIKLIYMHAQYYLKNYYISLGFIQKGKPFMEAGIKHIKMYYKS